MHPARWVPIAFLSAILAGTVLLMLPVARAGSGTTDLLTALFTATSAVCVTGLIVVDTPTYWSSFGQVVILALFQLGGFGIATGATLLGLLISRRLPLGRRLIAQAETRSVSLGDAGGVVKAVLLVTVVAEGLVALALMLRLHDRYGGSWGASAWNGLFHSVSSFNNAGFSTFSDSLVRLSLDPAVVLPLCMAVIVSGLGFPVLYELKSGWRRPRDWSIHAKLTVGGTALLLAVGFWERSWPRRVTPRPWVASRWLPRR